jgi:hypothetical protein
MVCLAFHVKLSSYYVALRRSTSRWNAGKAGDLSINALSDCYLLDIPEALRVGRDWTTYKQVHNHSQDCCQAKNDQSTISHPNSVLFANAIRLT